MNPDPIPFVGMTVHYVAYGTPKGEFPALVHRAAIITEIRSALSSGTDNVIVSLCVLNPTGLFFNTPIPFDRHASEGGTWHFIENDAREDIPF